jgi:hypothetical protein
MGIVVSITCYAAKSNNPDIVIFCSAGIPQQTQYKSCPQQLYKLNGQQLRHLRKLNIRNLKPLVGTIHELPLHIFHQISNEKPCPNLLPSLGIR